MVEKLAEEDRLVTKIEITNIISASTSVAKGFENLLRQDLQRGESISPTLVGLVNEVAIKGYPLKVSSAPLSSKIEKIVSCSLQPEDPGIQTSQNRNYIEGDANSSFSIIGSFSLGFDLAKYELKQLWSDPVCYLKDGVHEFISEIHSVGCKVRDSTVKLYDDFFLIIKHVSNLAIKEIKTFLVSPFASTPNTEYSYDKQTKKASITSISIYDTKSAKLLHGFSNSITKIYDLIIAFSEKPQYFFESLRDGIKKIASALSAKRELQKLRKVEESLDRKCQLQETAEAHKKVAETLRPDLALEVEVPQTNFIFTSAFSEVPSVGTMIDDALRKKAKKSIS